MDIKEVKTSKKEVMASERFSITFKVDYETDYPYDYKYDYPISILKET